jgi:hypothetical protein
MRRVTALGGTLLLILLPWLASASPASAQERGQPADAVTALRGPGPIGVLYTTGFRPPAEYRRWYEAMERCSGRRGHYAALEWYVVPTPWPGTNGLTYGLWSPQRIIVSAAGWRDSVLVSHEVLHDILWVSGYRPPESDSSHWAGHPVPPFNRCAPEYYAPSRSGLP